MAALKNSGKTGVKATKHIIISLSLEVGRYDVLLYNISLIVLNSSVSSCEALFALMPDSS